MVRPVHRQAHIAQTTRAEKAGVSKSLEAMKKKTNQFALIAKEKGFFSAGKPASFSDTPPRTGKRVSQAVSGTLTPAKTTRRK